LKSVIVYTDGACSGNPGPGGWGAILKYGNKKKEMSGGEAETTNNRMELMGVIAALSALKEPCIVSLYTDSQYIANAINEGWLKSWIAHNWKRKTGPVKNADLWKEIVRLFEVHQVEIHWVKGHAENEYNNRCDELAVAESRKYKK
jgi:ribonuclease HI